MTTAPGTFESRSAAETIEVGSRLAKDLAPGDVLALHGDLGSGKTCLVKGIAFGLGVTQEVTSPTYTLIHEYSGGRLPLVHVDLYRLETAAQAAEIGLEDYFQEGRVIVIEWAEKIEALLPDRARHIRLESTGETSRRIQVL